MERTREKVTWLLVGAVAMAAGLALFRERTAEAQPIPGNVLPMKWCTGVSTSVTNQAAGSLAALRVWSDGTIEQSNGTFTSIPPLYYSWTPWAPLPK